MFIFLMKIRKSKFFVQNIFHNPMLNAYLQHSNRATFSNKYCHNLTYWFFTMDCSRSTYYFVIVLLSVNLILLPYNLSVFASPAIFLSNIHYTPGKIYYQFARISARPIKKHKNFLWHLDIKYASQPEKPPQENSHPPFLNCLLKHEYR